MLPFRSFPYFIMPVKSNPYFVLSISGIPQAKLALERSAVSYFSVPPWGLSQREFQNPFSDLKASREEWSRAVQIQLMRPRDFACYFDEKTKQSAEENL